MSAAPGLGGIQQHQIEIASQASMLESVIEDKDFARQVGDGHRCQAHPIRSLQMGYVWQVILKNQSFVVGRLPVVLCAEVAGSGGATITPTQNGHAPTALAEEAGDIFNARGLTRAT
jgi:hypothetical protein